MSGSHTNHPLAPMRHSTAHVMAQAVQHLFPGAKFAFGPDTEDGFYYDIELPRPITADDLAAIESEMRKSVAAHSNFVQEDWPKDKAVQWFKEHDQPFKVEWISQLPDESVSIYQHGDFTDLCAGPHVANTGDIGAFKLLNIGGAYWRGDEKREQLTRIYGTVWNDEAELNDFLERLEDAKRRDHRRIGKELGLFTFSDLVGPGLPLWLPKGATIRRELERWVTDLELRRGYQHVVTPDVAKVEMYKTSGHWAHYQDAMFPVMKAGDEELVLRPMNCPHHIQIYQSTQHSYRDLPLRIAEFGTMWRYEKSGELSGLSRVRRMDLNDAHIFCTPDQILDEIVGVVKLIEDVYEVLGITEHWYRLSLWNPNDKEKYVDNPEMWERGERYLKEAMARLELEYVEAPGEAAFYGPKIDIQLRDPLGHSETISTIQLDFHLPSQFQLEYVGDDSAFHRPVMIHRGVIGTLVRMIAFLIEKYAGAFPVWLSPTQAQLIPITDKNVPYLRTLHERLLDLGVRSTLDDRNEKMQRKIAEAQTEKVPYMVVAGGRDEEAGTVSVRLRSGEQLPPMPPDEFINRILDDIQNRR
ncbi:MAG TPA: threonine--tRNA ligase [Chloroflexota bacterium]|nr:threonine--tRNA ligase [Chloroflexota bacterium]